MPRTLLERRYWERRRIAERALKEGIYAEWHGQGFPDFIDYWDAIPATFPEKLVFAELVRREISFKFSWYLGDLEVTPDYQERVRPDFILIDYHIIIEVVGTYWHSGFDQAVEDAMRAMALEASGYKVYALLDIEILSDVRAALDTIPELRGTTIKGGIAMVGERPIDPTAGLAARQRRWPKVMPVRWARPKGMPKTKGPVWAVQTVAPVQEAKELKYIYFGRPREMTEAAAKWTKWWLKYQKWLEHYTEWVGHPPVDKEEE